MHTRIIPRLNQSATDSAEYIRVYDFEWRLYTRYTYSMKKLFDYLDRYYLKDGQHKK
jgi:hypothetical protein